MSRKTCTQCGEEKHHVSFYAGSSVCRACQSEPRPKINDGRAPTLAEAEEKERPAPRPMPVPVSAPVNPPEKLPALELASSLEYRFCKDEEPEPETEKGPETDIDGGRLIVKAETSVELLAAVLIAVLDVCPDARCKSLYGELVITAGRQRESNQRKENTTDELEDFRG